MTTQSRPVGEVNAVDNSGSRLTATFYWLDDRYGHQITIHRRDMSRMLLESIEGGSDDIWPLSPPFQRFSEVTVKGDTKNERVTMLVGAAGKSHWAMTVSARDQVISNEPLVVRSELFFDVACRVKDQSAWLRSSYQVRGGQTGISEKRLRIRVPADPPGCEIIPENATLELETCAGPLPRIQLQATSTATESQPETVRWQYALRLCPE